MAPVSPQQCDRHQIDIGLLDREWECDLIPALPIQVGS